MRISHRPLKRRYRLAGAAVALAIAAFVAAAGSPAGHAAFPGVNGKIAFATNRDGQFEIYAMNSDGSGQTNLTNNVANDLAPSWSPDGTKIAFQSDRGGDPADIYVMNADGTGQTRLTTTSASDYDPAWSPDGTKIVFGSNRNGCCQIFVMNADGSGQTPLTNGGVSVGEPAWSPDGTKIAFVRGTGPVQIYVMNADGSGQTPLTNSFLNDHNPDWSPDGTKIAFHRGCCGSDQVYVMNADGSGQTNLSNSASIDEFPAWSPDGKKITFASTRDQLVRRNIYVMNADGSGVTRLTTAAADEFQPDWQPACHEADANGDIQGEQSGQASFQVDDDQCEDSDRQHVDASDPGANMNFHSTLILSLLFDDVAHSMTIVGQGLDNGLPVTFTAVGVDNGSTAVDTFSLTLSDGYRNIGNLLDGNITLR